MLDGEEDTDQSQMGIQIPNRPPFDVRVSCPVVFNCAQSPSTPSDPACLPLPKGSWKTLKRSTLGHGKCARTFYVPEDEGNPQNVTHTKKLASKLKLPTNHKMHFLTLICGLNYRHAHHLLQASSAVGLRVK